MHRMTKCALQPVRTLFLLCHFVSTWHTEHWTGNFLCSYVQPFRSDSDPLVIRGVESVIFLSEVLLYALLLKVVDFLQLILCDEKFCG